MVELCKHSSSTHATQRISKISRKCCPYVRYGIGYGVPVLKSAEEGCESETFSVGSRVYILLVTGSDHQVFHLSLSFIISDEHLEA